MKGFNYFIKLTVSILFLVIILITSLFLIAYTPISLQKTLTIKPINNQELVIQKNRYEENINEFNVEHFISSIPYNSTETTFSVLPKDRFEESIINGNGNCSNLIFGAAYYFLENQMDFYAIHLLPLDNFLDGYGHTVLYMNFRLNDSDIQEGIVDIFEASIPTVQGLPIDIDELITSRGNIELYTINSLNRERFNYFRQSYLEDKVLGSVNSEEIQRYFNFLENIYISLGNEELEKLVYDSLAIIFGYFPNTIVTKTDFNQLFHGKWLIVTLAYGWLWSIRIVLLITISYMIILPIIIFIQKGESVRNI